tara:strand:+ start:199 stop:825 length:627 start_codon:yes stop_codon:yes gene_type:complete
LNRKTILILLSLSCINAQISRYDAKPTLAVFNFEGKAISDDNMTILLDTLISELYKTNAFIMVEEHQMNEIILEQKYDNLDCRDQRCGTEIGMILGIKNIIIGSFEQIADSTIMKASIIHVKNRETKKSVNKAKQGELEGLFPLIQIAAWEFADLEPPNKLLKKAGLLTEEKDDDLFFKKWFRWVMNQVSRISDRFRKDKKDDAEKVS